VARTDIVQVSLLVLGGLIICYIALNKISGNAGMVAGFHELTVRFPEKFKMILPPSNPNYKNLPGLSVLLGGMWVMNVSYWGFNQYIIQRALGAKDIREAQKGIVLAAFLKLLMPVIIVLPGIAAAALAPNLARPDEAYPHLMAMLPTGILGLVFAALIAAIVTAMKPVGILSARNIVGEGILWDSRRGLLWWTDIQGRELYQYDRTDAAIRVLDTPERVGSSR
jgi:SSS family solute:Na+ symporter